MDPRKRFFSPFTYDEAALKECALKAGLAIMEHFGQKSSGDLNLERKDDNSPVCIADKKSHEIVAEYLKNSFPDIPVLSEEDPDIEITRRNIDVEGRYFAIDPLDGTETFIKGKKDFAVNIALIEGGFPRFGLIYAPAHHEMWFGDVYEKRFSYVHLLTKQTKPIAFSMPNRQIVLGVPNSQKRDDAFCLWLGAKLETAPMLPIGASLKFSRIADGMIDIYPRFKPSMIWDAAAGQAIVEACGGMVVSLSQLTLKDIKFESPLNYHPMRLTNPNFAAFSAPALKYLGLNW